jgi:hypothetical protein
MLVVFVISSALPYSDQEALDQIQLAKPLRIFMGVRSHFRLDWRALSILDYVATVARDNGAISGLWDSSNGW